MHRLVPRIEVYPCQPLDGGAVVLRAELTANLAPLLGAAGDGLGGLMVGMATVNLFDAPQRIAYRERAVALRERGLTERATARELGLTQPAVQRTMALHRKMQAAGATDAYRRLMAPTDGKPGRTQAPAVSLRAARRLSRPDAPGRDVASRSRDGLSRPTWLPMWGFFVPRPRRIW